MGNVKLRCTKSKQTQQPTKPVLATPTRALFVWCIEWFVSDDEPSCSFWARHASNEQSILCCAVRSSDMLQKRVLLSREFTWNQNSTVNTPMLTSEKRNTVLCNQTGLLSVHRVDEIPCDWFYEDFGAGFGSRSLKFMKLHVCLCLWKTRADTNRGATSLPVFHF